MRCHLNTIGQDQMKPGNSRYMGNAAVAVFLGLAIGSVDVQIATVETSVIGLLNMLKRSGYDGTLEYM